MTEERIKNAAETIHSANKQTITEGILRTVAAEAREEGRKEGIEEAAKAIECDGPWTLLGAIARVNALKEKEK